MSQRHPSNSVAERPAPKARATASEIFNAEQFREIREMGEYARELSKLVETERRKHPRPAKRKESGPSDTSGFDIVSVGALLDEPEDAADWLVDDLMPWAGLVFVAGKPKGGKSTLVRNLAVAVARGDEFLGRDCCQGRVIYLGLEEKRSEVRRHFRQLGATSEDPVYVHVATAPKDALAALVRLVRELKPVLVIIDPLLRFTRVRDEKAYAELSNALEGVMQAAREHNCCIVATHHSPKAQGGEAIDSLLGSTALSGAPDTVMVVRRREQERTVETVQRYGNDMERTVLTLDADTGLVRLAGAAAETHRAQTRDKILKALVGGSDRTTDELRVQISAAKQAVITALDELERQGTVTRNGRGVRGDPTRYRLAPGIPFSVLEPTLGMEKRKVQRPQNPCRDNDEFRSADRAAEASAATAANTETGSDLVAAVLATFPGSTATPSTRRWEDVPDDRPRRGAELATVRELLQAQGRDALRREYQDAVRFGTPDRWA